METANGGDAASVTDAVRVFDTTLRDGEQSPGATLTLPEKLEIASHLESMGVDVIEAGFPISSDGDFESVRAIAAEITRSVVCGLARCAEASCTPISSTRRAVSSSSASAASRGYTLRAKRYRNTSLRGGPPAMPWRFSVSSRSAPHQSGCWQRSPTSAEWDAN